MLRVGWQATPVHTSQWPSPGASAVARPSSFWTSCRDDKQDTLIGCIAHIRGGALTNDDCAQTAGTSVRGWPSSECDSQYQCST